MKRIPFLGQLGVFNRLPGLLGSGIDLPNPTRDGYASARYCLRSVPLRVGKDQTGNKEDDGACMMNPRMKRIGVLSSTEG